MGGRKTGEDKAKEDWEEAAAYFEISVFCFKSLVSANFALLGHHLMLLLPRCGHWRDEFVVIRQGRQGGGRKRALMGNWWESAVTTSGT